jgi:hypothetical protein
MPGGVALELLPVASSKNRRMDRMGHRRSHTMAIGQKPDDRGGIDDVERSGNGL